MINIYEKFYLYIATGNHARQKLCKVLFMWEKTNAIKNNEKNQALYNCVNLYQLYCRLFLVRQDWYVAAKNECWVKSTLHAEPEARLLADEMSSRRLRHVSACDVSGRYKVINKATTSISLTGNGIQYRNYSRLIYGFLELMYKRILR